MTATRTILVPSIHASAVTMNEAAPELLCRHSVAPSDYPIGQRAGLVGNPQAHWNAVTLSRQPDEKLDAFQVQT